MVQRKAPPKLGSQSQAKRNHVKLERQLSSHQHQDARGKGGGDLKRKMKKVRSIKVSDLETLEASAMKPKRPSTIEASSPNFMKPTSSWDARKEQLQVTLHSHTTADKKTSRVRQSSLKPVRPSMKKNLKNVMVNRATCSSTLKEPKFPKALDLNPGGTEAEGTSVVTVCPYTYCSLNGHRHEPLPPLKCFMSARRKLLKTQKSMKLKVKSKKIDTGQTGLKIAPLTEEVANEFFVEIYTTRPQEQIIEPGICDEEGVQTEALGELAGIGNSRECAKSKVEEDDRMNESYSDISFEDDIDQSGELSNEEMDVMMGFMEYVECDQLREEAEKENIPGSVPENYAEWCFECCLVDVSSKDCKVMAENENKVSTIEATDMDWEEEVGQFSDNKSEYSECPDDGFSPMSRCDELAIEPINYSIAGDVAEADAEPPKEVDEEVADNGDTLAFDDGNSDDKEEISRLDALDVNSNTEELESSEENDQGDASMVEGNYFLSSSEENISHSSFQGSEEEVSDLEAQQNLDNESIEEEENRNEEVVDTMSFFIVQLSDSSQGFVEINEGTTDVNPIQIELEIEVGKCGDATEDESIPPEVPTCPSDDQSVESNTEENWKYQKEQQEEVSKTKARLSIIRKRTTEESEKMKEFNPRAPRFLPVEPDPEAEKVDLRHQFIDERKNAEEWMIDYALQRAVNNLAPARKRKVALLVEAFETVTPLPMCEKPLRHTTTGFAHARSIQACS